MASPAKRPIRIAANCGDDPVDVISGDWMSEGNMTGRAAIKASPAGDAYEPTFLEALEPALPYIAQHHIKVAVNAGASDTKLPHSAVTKMIQAKGLDLDVAWVSGDEVLSTVKKMMTRENSPFENICTGEKLKEWKFMPIYAQAYLGGLGIAAAFAKGVDIVQRSNIDCLANAFIAGHLVECSSYVCGGNFTGFKYLENKGWDDIGYPIAEISSSRDVTITKSKNSGGEEIQGPWYFNSDVTAILDELYFEQLSADRVALRGVKSGLPPPTTKIGITAQAKFIKGGFQAEAHWFLVGLDIDAKARMVGSQIRKLLEPYAHSFSKLTFTRNDSSAEDPIDQNFSTIDFRVFAQALKIEDIMPKKFLRPCFDVIMEACPGATPNLDWRLGIPKVFYEYYVTPLPQVRIQHMVNLSSGESLIIPPAPKTKSWPQCQPSQPRTRNGADLSEFGQTIRGPLGWIVHARNGDKGSDCNVGFWVRFKDEWDWLRTLLSVEKIKELLAAEYNGNAVVSISHAHTLSLWVCPSLSTLSISLQ
ncbi:DUF1446-domain-containing protein [Glonium stellatum]|uniref:DUF1446-domain-containing protein n=1 Tax=Glonium stellatum TaxID=574774 RepID=A0A8E2EN96_9PEZI|nr:DUF1446-domain-containing protein [Glonium stellatum]